MRTLFVLSLLLSSLLSFSQISKKQWLVGGDGTFSIINPSYNYSKYRSMEFSAGGGYFLINKLAVGIRAGYKHNMESGENTNIYYKQTSTQINVRPFVRYYFLPINRKLNLLTDVSYYHGWVRDENLYGYSKGKTFGYSFASGPAFFITPNSALELTLNYDYDKSWYYTKSWRMKVGFQIHLGDSQQK